HGGPVQDEEGPLRLGADPAHHLAAGLHPERGLDQAVLQGSGRGLPGPGQPLPRCHRLRPAAAAVEGLRCHAAGDDQQLRQCRADRAVHGRGGERAVLLHRCHPQGPRDPGPHRPRDAVRGADSRTAQRLALRRPPWAPSSFPPPTTPRTSVCGGGWSRPRGCAAGSRTTTTMSGTCWRSIRTGNRWTTRPSSASGRKPASEAAADSAAAEGRAISSTRKGEAQASPFFLAGEGLPTDPDLPLLLLGLLLGLLLLLLLGLLPLPLLSPPVIASRASECRRGRRGPHV